MPDTETSRFEQRNANPPSPDSGVLKTVLLELITAAEPPEVAAILDELWAMEEFSVGQAPAAGLVMVTVRDPFDTDFFLGEALITRAAVVCNGVTGEGTILGEEPARALLLAAVEALELSGREAALKIVGDFVTCLKQRELQRRQRFSKIAAATNVCFESMKREQVDFGSLGV
jgi:phosphonate C-P lyase system protein PhnG